jgi:voltage-dependent potassium channel beta subunit
MNYRRMGGSGLKLSELSLGAWVTYGSHVAEEVGAACMEAAYDGGVNFFDNAEAYGRGNAEIVMGNILHKFGWRRGSYVVSTKFYWGMGHGGPNDKGLSRKRLFDGIDGSLKRLQLDYVDLIYCHRADPETPIEETVFAMHDIVTSGRALYWGTSEWSPDEYLEAWHIAERHHLHKPQVEQPQYHMLHRQRVEREFARLYDTVRPGMTTWSPLASGLLSGKYNDGVPEGSRLALPTLSWLKDAALVPANLEKVRKLGAVAKGLGCTMSQLALAWILKNPHVSSVITGASRVEQVKENLGAVDVAAKLTPEVMQGIEAILQNQPEAWHP